MTQTPIAAVVLAAGKGSRMGSDLHKVLHKIAGKPMLAHVLDTLAKMAVAQTVVVVGAGRDQIHRAYPDLQTVVQERQLGTADAVMAAQPALAEFKGTVLILYGDVPLVRPATLGRLCARVGGDVGLAVLGFCPEETRSYGRLVTDEAGNLLEIVEHADADAATRAIGFCNSGIMAVQSAHLFDLLKQIDNHNSKGEYYLTDIVAKARAAGCLVATAKAEPAEVAGVNSQEELAELNRQLAQAGPVQDRAQG